MAPQIELNSTAAYYVNLWSTGRAQGSLLC